MSSGVQARSGFVRLAGPLFRRALPCRKFISASSPQIFVHSSFDSTLVCTTVYLGGMRRAGGGGGEAQRQVNRTFTRVHWFARPQTVYHRIATRLDRKLDRSRLSAHKLTRYPYLPACVLCSLCDIPTAAPESPLTPTTCLPARDLLRTTPNAGHLPNSPTTSPRGPPARLCVCGCVCVCVWGGLWVCVGVCGCGCVWGCVWV